MPDPRDAVLRRVRAALADAPGAAEPVRGYRLRAGTERPDLLATFAERAREYGVGVRRVARADVRTCVSALLADEGARRVGIPVDLPAPWRPEEIDLIEDRELSPAQLDDLDGALTGSALAIAETGTVVLDSGRAQGRRALTLVPDLHVCVVEAEQVVGSVPEAIAELSRDSLRESRPVTLVSGPSATSDIELNRVEGVHGPRRLRLVIVEELG